MSSFILKIIAIISMFIDHLGDAYYKATTSMNLIGRIAFPIFAFQISEGYLHTKNLKKYFLRLTLFAFISQIPFMLFHSMFNSNMLCLNIFFTLLLGLLAIFIYNKCLHSNFAISKTHEKLNIIFKYLTSIVPVIFLGLFAEILNCDYGFWGVLIIFLFYVLKNHKFWTALCFALACIIRYSIVIFQNGYHPMYVKLCLFTILPIALISCYNGKQGKKLKYFLYVFYPVHLLILYLIFK